METDDKFVLSFSASQFASGTKINDDEFEDVFYGLSYAAGGENGTKELVRVVLDPYEYEVRRSTSYVEPDPKFVCKLHNLLKRERASSVVQLHWHKFSTEPEFSFQDDQCARLLLADAARAVPHIKVIQIVFGRQSEHFKARYLDRKEKFIYFDTIEIIGPQGIEVIPKVHSEPLPNAADRIFEKNVIAFSQKGVEKIRKTSVSVIGAGGIGSGLLYQMARIGFEKVTVIDFDRIEASNCNRQYFIIRPRRALGMNKTDLVKKGYRQFNRKAEIECYAGSVSDPEAQNMLKRADLVVLAVDNDAARAVVNSFCARYAKPLVNVATGIVMDKEGRKIASAGIQLQWFIPREESYPCLRCHGSLSDREIQRVLMSESLRENRKRAGYVENTSQSPVPQVMPLNGIATGLAMWEITAWIAGIKRPSPWLYYDAMQNKLIQLNVRQNPTCSCCGLNETSILALGDDIQRLEPKAEGPGKGAGKRCWIKARIERAKHRLHWFKDVVLSFKT